MRTFLTCQLVFLFCVCQAQSMRDARKECKSLRKNHVKSIMCEVSYSDEEDSIPEIVSHCELLLNERGEISSFKYWVDNYYMTGWYNKNHMLERCEVIETDSGKVDTSQFVFAYDRQENLTRVNNSFGNFDKDSMIWEIAPYAVAYSIYELFWQPGSRGPGYFTSPALVFFQCKECDCDGRPVFPFENSIFRFRYSCREEMRFDFRQWYTY
jgi:hypothetical protein